MSIYSKSMSKGTLFALTPTLGGLLDQGEVIHKTSGVRSKKVPCQQLGTEGH
jgi:hypothetical protein